MRLIKIVLLSLAALLVVATSANAEIIRLDTTYAGTALNVSDTVNIDVYLDCECAGGAGDPSDYLGIQFNLEFDDAVLSYDSASSTPNSAPVNGGTSELGVEIFGNQGKAAGMLINGGVASTPYYSAGGGPHQPDAQAPDSTVLFLYISKQIATQLGPNVGGEWLMGNIVLQVDATGTSSNVTIGTPVGETFLFAFEDTSTLDLAGTTVQGEFTVLTVPEPTIAGGSLAVLLTLYGLHARRRNG